MMLQKVMEQGFAQVVGYNCFDFISLQRTSITLRRENGNDAEVPFKKLLIAIDGYKNQQNDYNAGPVKLRSYGLTHITSPIFSLLHLLPKEIYGM
jgi:hypothetical protein